MVFFFFSWFIAPYTFFLEIETLPREASPSLRGELLRLDDKIIIIFRYIAVFGALWFQCWDVMFQSLVNSFPLLYQLT